MQELAAYAASLTIGLLLGLIGAGGSIVTIPVFVYILHKDPASSSIYSMFVVGICSLAGSIRSMLNKLVDFKITLLFGIPSVLGVLTARQFIYPAIPQQLLCTGSFILSKNILFMLCLSVLMFFAAVKMLKVASCNKANQGTSAGLKTGPLLLQGLLAGIVTGLLGIGGGFLIVPALYFWAKLPMKMAVGTALLIITINSLFSFLNSYTTIVLDWALLLKFSVGAIFGIIAGAKLSSKIQGAHLKKIFGWFVLGVSCYIMYKQFFL